MEYSTRSNLPQYKRRRVWMVVWRVLVYVVLNVLFYMVFVRGGYFRNTVIAVIAAVIFAAVSFWLMRLAEFFERSWDGVIVSAWYEREKTPLNPVFLYMCHRNFHLRRQRSIPDRVYKFCGNIYDQIYVTVHRTDNGKCYTYTIKDDTADKANLRYFKEGEEVRHHRCMRYFERKNKSDVRRLLCVGCGQFNLSSADQCVRCRLPLLK